MMLFAGTFFISLFVLMMQFVWKYIDTLIGKGLTLDVMAQFFWYMAATATTRVLMLDRMLEKVLVITDSTPAMSPVMRVMISPWLVEVKNRWLIFCRWRNIWQRMS